jgi:hypothetical protein
MKKITKKDENIIQNVILLLNFQATYYEKHKTFPDLETCKKATNLTSQFINKVENNAFDNQTYRNYYSKLSHDVFHALYLKAKAGDIQAIKVFLDFVNNETNTNNEIKINVNLLTKGKD